MIKFDVSGGILWAKAVGGTGNEHAYFVRQASDGGYILTGNTDTFNGVGQILVSKFDGAGTFQWASSLGNPSDGAAGHSVQQTTDGGYIVTGYHAGAIGGLGLLKYDTMGQLQWLRRASGVNHSGNFVQQTSDGGYIVAGDKQFFGVSLLKFDGSGGLQWAQFASGSDVDRGNAVQQTSDGGYIGSGHTGRFGAGGNDASLLKYSALGELQWARTAGGAGDDTATSVQQTSDGGYIVSGHTASFGGQAISVFLLRFDSAGALQWAKAGGSIIPAFPVEGSPRKSTMVQQTSDGGYVVGATTAGSAGGGTDVLLIRTDANGNVAGCDDWSSVTPSIGTNFVSAPASYGNDSPGLSAAARTLGVSDAPLTSTIQCPVAVQVQIDIKPGSFPNSINLGSGGTVPVAIFSTATFDATTVDPLTVTLASAPVELKGKGTPMASFQDVNGDGLLDLIVHVSTEALQLSETDTQAILEGKTFSGTPIKGTDSVRVVP